MRNKEKSILLLVEGKSTEVKLFNKIIECFEDIDLKKQNVIVYNTNLFVLNNALVREFGEAWYDEEIDFLEFLKNNKNTKNQISNLQNTSKTSEEIKSIKFTDIFLIFDYERQDPFFDANLINKMLAFWSESTENGLLYINYPMIEAYKHIKKPLPDYDYLSRKCDCLTLFSKETKKNKYKQVVGDESSFTDIEAYTKELFRELVIHNLCKASTITRGTKEISTQIAKDYWETRDYEEILDVENRCSFSSQTGFVYVLATCLFFIVEYNSKLIFGTGFIE